MIDCRILMAAPTQLETGLSRLLARTCGDDDHIGVAANLRIVGTVDGHGRVQAGAVLHIEHFGLHALLGDIFEHDLAGNATLGGCEGEGGTDCAGTDNSKLRGLDKRFFHVYTSLREMRRLGASFLTTSLQQYSHNLTLAALTSVTCLPAAPWSTPAVSRLRPRRSARIDGRPRRPTRARHHPAIAHPGHARIRGSDRATHAAEYGSSASTCTPGVGSSASTASRNCRTPSPE